MLRSYAQSIGFLIAGLAVLVSVAAFLVALRSANLLLIASMLAMMLGAFVGILGLSDGRAWGALLIALWAAIAVAVTVIYFSDITGIDGIRIPFAVAALAEIGVAIALATAPTAKAG